MGELDRDIREQLEWNASRVDVSIETRSWDDERDVTFVNPRVQFIGHDQNRWFSVGLTPDQAEDFAQEILDAVKEARSR